jgi:valyl-tRNA synthetase
VKPQVLKLVAGKPAKKARGMVVELLQEQGFLTKTEDHNHSIGKCYRCRTVVEPFLSPQWFVKTSPLAEPAIKVVEDGKIRFVPKGWENTYFDWMRNIKDWCISRQIWWGHRIPAWYCDDCGHITVSRTDAIQCAKCNSRDIRQETDVLDTWFSSALWPFSTLGWPERTRDLAVYYPTSVLVTSFDIIFFWVARMIMMGLRFMEEIPFRDVYIHALVRDAEGQKMSKSKGNVIDPLEMTETYGTDAFRFTLVAFAAQGRDIKMSTERIEGYRNFANKIWNASRFVMLNLEEGFAPNSEVLNEHSTRADKWIVSRLQTAIKEVNTALEEYRFNDAASSLYHFIWHEYCDWYVEMSKGALKSENHSVRKATQTVLVAVLESTLRLLHPIMPFITEEIWQKLPAGVKGKANSIIVSAFPKADEELISIESERYMKPSMDINLSFRNIRGEMNIPPSARPEAVIRPETEEARRIIEDTKPYITSLSGLSNVHIAMDAIFPPGSAMSSTVWAVSGLFLPEKALDVNAERDRLQKEIGKLSKDIEVFSKKLSNKNFVEKAPKEVVVKDTAKLEEFRAKRAKLEQSLALLNE